MTDYVADTHALIWYLTDSDQLGPAASAAFDACDAGEAAIYVPTICLVELIYLQEKGRIPGDMKAALDTHLTSGRTGLYTVDLTPTVVKALAEVSRDLVPDLPDRIVAATAKALNLPLLTRDRALQKAGLKVVW
jgi:PIN domain nuclease of toxin-antitoxin system